MVRTVANQGHMSQLRGRCHSAAAAKVTTRNGRLVLPEALSSPREARNPDFYVEKSLSF